MPSDLRVLIVADDPLARAGLATLLEGQPGCRVVGQVSGEDAGAEILEVYSPDVAVWDLGWDSSASLDRLAGLPDLNLPVVALLPDATRAAEVWAAGPRGMLLRSSSAATIRGALVAVAQGLAALGPELTEAFLPSGERMQSTEVEELTPRELEVARLLAEGLPNKAIAARLGISEHTVKFHVTSIMGKLGAQSRTEAVTRAMRAGLILL